jgi:Ca2+-binding EF-hand superfamily protein
VFDGDGNGFISRRELGQMMKFMGEALTDKEIQMIIDEADIDHDGQIDYTEFFSLMHLK